MTDKYMADFIRAKDRRISYLEKIVLTKRLKEEEETVGRNTFFVGSQRFLIPIVAEAAFSFTERIGNITFPAGQETYVTGLSCEVALIRRDDAGDLNFQTTLFPTARGYGLAGAPQLNFDFDWNFEIGSTNRRYASSLAAGAEQKLSSRALLFASNGDDLWFSKRNPLKMDTNQFLSFRLVPTLYVTDANFGPVLDEAFIAVDFQARGYRVLT